MIGHSLERFSTGCAQIVASPEFSAVQALQILDTLSLSLAGITGSQTDRMTRDDGWRLLAIGRHVERLGFLAECLQSALSTGAFDDTNHDDAGGGSHFAALLALFDSAITFRAQHQQSRELEPLVALLVQDDENPRALAWVARALRGRLAKLARTPLGEPDPIGRAVPDPGQWPLHLLCSRTAEGRLSSLAECLESCRRAAWQVSDAVSARYFQHIERAGTVGV